MSFGVACRLACCALVFVCWCWLLMLLVVVGCTTWLKFAVLRLLFVVVGLIVECVGLFLL